MKINTQLLLILILLPVISISQQNLYRVFFTDKNNCTFNPYNYFDHKAIERRIKNNINLYDSSDFPVNENYINKVKEYSDSLISINRWFNYICITTDNQKINDISQLPFVKNIEALTLKGNLCSNDNINEDTITILTNDVKNLLIKQTEILEGKLFDSAGYDGKGIRIAIFDAGFPTVNISNAFKKIRDEGRIIKTWDFAKNKEFVYGYSSHGLMVMSCIAGIYQGQKIGLATGAEFLLARTEVNGEPYFEEENWLQAVEWADKNGADIINSSLGYTYQRYFNYDMNGKTSLVAKAANLAAKKGILVVNAAGNEGDSKWKVIGTPADADSVLSIGGIDPETYYHIYFSSYGPTSDGRTKPNVCAFGEVAAITKKDEIKKVQGTSFSSPLIAGFAACAWQANPQLNNMELFKEIEKSAHLYPYFDYAHGYGIPKASYFLNKKKSNKPTFEFIKKVDEIIIKIYPEYLIDNSLPNLLYCNIQNETGKIELYKVIQVEQEEVSKIIINNNLKNKIINAHYKGYTNSIKIN
ncbi:MAG TPA: S8 family serine peptidase [Bacteroidales bacterium]|nr:S8 family serine peptidase [Bacteroidales bacterium]